MDRISPTGDLAFKKVLASEENKDILSGLIHDFFGLTVPAAEIKLEVPYNIEVYKEYINGEEISTLRQTIKDVIASFMAADFISEMQVSKQRHFDFRALWYPFNQFCKNYNKAERMETAPGGRYDRYSSLIPVYSLNVLGYNLFDEAGDNDALRVFQLYDPVRKKKYIKDLMQIGFFEIEKSNIETVNQRHWRDYFKTGEASPDAPDYIKKASGIIRLVNLSEEERNVDSLLERAQAREDAVISGAYNDGLDYKAQEIAIRMIRRNKELADIAEDTGLDISFLQSLKSKIGY